MWKNKIGTWVWVGLLALLMIVEVVIVKLPRVNGINVASQQLTGQTASSPTDLSQLTGTTTVATTTPASGAVGSLMGVIVIIFVAVIILGAIMGMTGSDHS